MFEILTLHPKAFGLDISDLSLKIVSLEKRGKNLNVVSFGETPLKPGIIKKGEVKSINFLAQNIKKAIEAVSGKKIDTKNVIVSLPEEKALYQVINMLKISKEDL